MESARQSGHGSAAAAEEQSCPGSAYASPSRPSSMESGLQRGHRSAGAAEEQSCPGSAHASPGRPCSIESGRKSGHSSAATAEEQSCPGSGDHPTLPPLLLPDEIVEVMQKDKATLETRLDEVARGLEKLKEENVRKRAMIETFRGQIDRIDKAIAELKELLREIEEDTTKQEAAAAGPSGANSYSGVPTTSSSTATSSLSPTTVPAPMVISQRNACPAEATAATPAEEEESDRPLNIMDLL